MLETSTTPRTNTLRPYTTSRCWRACAWSSSCGAPRESNHSAHRFESQMASDIGPSICLTYVARQGFLYFLTPLPPCHPSRGRYHPIEFRRMTGLAMNTFLRTIAVGILIVGV